MAARKAPRCLRPDSSTAEPAASTAPGKAQTLLLYADAVTPGSLLQPDLQRKTVAFNCSIAGLLSMDSPYISTLLKTVRGGLSQCWKTLLRFLEPLFQSGATVDLGEGVPRLLIFADIRFIMDEEAIQMSFSTKGASGRRPCLRCRNCIAKDCPAAEVSTYFRSVAHTDFQDFEELPDHEIFECWDALAASQDIMRKQDFQELEKNTGFRYNPESLLAQRDLRHRCKPSQVRYDILHCFLQGGIASVEVGLFRQTWLETGRSWADFLEGVDNTQLLFQNGSGRPQRKNPNLRYLKPPCFSEKHVWRCRGSEQLACLPVLFLQAAIILAGKLEGVLEEARRSLLLLCERLYCVQMLRYTGLDVWAHKLLEKQQEHHRQFVLSYTAAKCKPKHHYASHLPGQHLKDGYVLDTLCNESKHRAIKLIVETSIFRLCDFETSLLCRLGQLHLHEAHQLQTQHWQWTLSRRRDKLASAALTLHLQQPLLRGTEAGIIVSFLGEGNVAAVRVQAYELQAVLAEGLRQWTACQRTEDWPLQAQGWHAPKAWRLHEVSLLTVW